MYTHMYKAETNDTADLVDGGDCPFHLALRVCVRIHGYKKKGMSHPDVIH